MKGTAATELNFPFWKIWGGRIAENIFTNEYARMTSPSTETQLL